MAVVGGSDWLAGWLGRGMSGLAGWLARDEAPPPAGECKGIPPEAAWNGSLADSATGGWRLAKKVLEK